MTKHWYFIPRSWCFGRARFTRRMAIALARTKQTKITVPAIEAEYSYNPDWIEK